MIKSNLYINIETVDGNYITDFYNEKKIHSTTEKLFDYLLYVFENRARDHYFGEFGKVTIERGEPER